MRRDPILRLPWLTIEKSGVYLGNYHGKPSVLAVNHSRAGPFELGAIIYNAVAGSARRLLNPDSAPSDTLLFRIDSAPKLSPLNLASISV